eukprot:Seg1719.8 transcript_id=Seg1719.8/GoldUCD/mRNA.D3Y31 product="hypothetical protein" protein_id=Seg1719.8/GoldUCD/D3Y31
METQKDLGSKKLAKSKSTSTSLENQALRDTISASQYKLMRCEEELKKTKDQLKCLVHLVKKAWTGDVEASIHVANIVGVAPPDLEIRADTNKLVAVPKSAALNNWACLTIGLLNKKIKKEEWERKVNQLVYLREREKFLDNQLDGFVQDPDFRSAEDAAKKLTGEILKNLKEDQDVKQKSTKELQLEIQLQKEKLNEKQQIFKSHVKLRDKRFGRTANDYSKQEHLADFDLNVSMAQIKQKQKATENPQRAGRKMTVQRAKTLEEIDKAYSLTTPHAQLPTATDKRPPRPKSARPVTKSDFKVEVTRKKQRAFSANEHPALQVKTTIKMVDNVRRKSLDNSFRRDEYKLDHIERELKRTTSELQKKLNINPKGCLNFR